MKWFKKLKYEFIERFTARLAYRITEDIVHKMLADLGVDELDLIVKRARENREKVGHSDYRNLAELYISIMRERRR